MDDPTCIVTGCDRLVPEAGRRCKAHQLEWRRRRFPKGSQGNVWARVEKDGPNGCWLWVGSKTHDGYGNLKRGGRIYVVHRYVYELVAGPIPEGLELDHLCFVRNCVNPEHLEPVTGAENRRRMHARRRAQAS